MPSSKEEEKKQVDYLYKVAEETKPREVYFPCNIKEFDLSIDGGFRGGELVTVSGQTGMGKTLLCETFTKKFEKQGFPCLWFSYEMSPYYLNAKFLDIKVNTKEAEIFSPVDLSNATIDFLRERVKEAKDKYACKFIFIDHLHYLIPLKSVKSSSLFIGGIVRELKKMAVQLNVIVFLIAHTKKIYQDEELDLSSIRDTSLIAQESDYVFLIERIKKDEDKKQKKLEKKVVETEWTNKSRVKLAKNRRTGKLKNVIFKYHQKQLKPLEKYEELFDED
ncbi:MAG: DnaB-like helicase C-terminal domain-containing protein [Atribacterota bacterium]